MSNGNGQHRFSRKPITWKTFSLRALLIITAIFAIWFASILRRVRAQQAVIELARENNGLVFYDYSFPTGIQRSEEFVRDAEPVVPEFLTDIFGVDAFHSVVFVSLPKPIDPSDDTYEKSDAALQILGRLPSLKTVILENRNIRDESLAHLRGLSDLQFVSFRFARISDEGVRHFEPLENLRQIYLDAKSEISDEGMKVIGRLKQIEQVNLSASSISNAGFRAIANATRMKRIMVYKGSGEITIDDAGIQYVRGLPDLEELGIGESQVTDAGLTHFEGLKKLRVLSLGSSKLTQPAKNRLMNTTKGLVVY